MPRFVDSRTRFCGSSIWIISPVDGHTGKRVRFGFGMHCCGDGCATDGRREGSAGNCVQIGDSPVGRERFVGEWSGVEDGVTFPDHDTVGSCFVGQFVYPVNWFVHSDEPLDIRGMTLWHMTPRHRAQWRGPALTASDAAVEACPGTAACDATHPSGACRTRRHSPQGEWLSSSLGCTNAHLDCFRAFAAREADADG